MGYIMTKCYVVTDETGRVVVWTEIAQGVGFIETETPDGMTQGTATDWKYDGETWSYDPLPEPEPEIDRLTAVEMQLAALCGDACEGV